MFKITNYHEDTHSMIVMRVPLNCHNPCTASCSYEEHKLVRFTMSTLIVGKANRNRNHSEVEKSIRPDRSHVINAFYEECGYHRTPLPKKIVIDSSTQPLGEAGQEVERKD
jgi:hypothetical protein